MKHPKRIATAFIAGKFISNLDAGAIYDLKSSEHHFFAGDVAKDDVSVYDLTRLSHIGGSMESLYDFHSANHISLEINGKDFSGYDFETGYHFSGNCDNGSISFYDFENSEYYNFAI